MCSKLTLKTRNDVNWCRCGVFIVNFQHNHCKTQDINRVVYLGPGQMFIMGLVKVANRCLTGV